jgi:hypothetical protein
MEILERKYPGALRFFRSHCAGGVLKFVIMCIQRNRLIVHGDSGLNSTALKWRYTVTRNEQQCIGTQVVNALPLPRRRKNLLWLPSPVPKRISAMSEGQGRNTQPNIADVPPDPTAVSTSQIGLGHLSNITSRVLRQE